MKIDPVTPLNTTIAEKVVEPELQKSEPAQITDNELPLASSSPPKQVQELIEGATNPSPPKVTEELKTVEAEILVQGPVMKSDEKFSQASKLKKDTPSKIEDANVQKVEKKDEEKVPEVEE